ncbi:MAG: TolC family protein [Gemmatimonadota bacterium]|nr:TolC family protein [Gemmatimonadota bacterium]
MSTGLALSPADTSRLSLDEAVARALEANATLRAERASAAAARQLPLQASQAFLPSVTLDLQGLRTTDPVAVFGLKLRQGNFTGPDLSLAALNGPDAYSGFNAVASVQWPLLAPEGLFGYAAARKVAAAQTAAAGRASGATRFLVTQAYFDAQLTTYRLDALDSALTAVRAHRDQAEAMRSQGLVTGLDARLAGLRASELEVQRLTVAARADVAMSALRMMLALPEATVLVLTDSLRSTEPQSMCAEGATTCALDDRGDLVAVRMGSDAARLGIKKAWASQLPAVAAFGSVAHYARSTPFGTGSGDWTVGIGVSWPILRGLAGAGAVRAAKAESEAAAARREAAERQAALEVLEATRMLTAARARVRVAGAAELEGREALEQARLRYRTGAAPITELLDVQAAATNAALNYLAARRDLHVVAAALDLAYGVYDR